MKAGFKASFRIRLAPLRWRRANAELHAELGRADERDAIPSCANNRRRNREEGEGGEEEEDDDEGRKVNLSLLVGALCTRAI